MLLYKNQTRQQAIQNTSRSTLLNFAYISRDIIHTIRYDFFLIFRKSLNKYLHVSESISTYLHRAKFRLRFNIKYAFDEI